jgi:protein-S-isoprenylcysteine O-methyltransferase Ste14
MTLKFKEQITKIKSFNLLEIGMYLILLEYALMLMMDFEQRTLFWRILAYSLWGIGFIFYIIPMVELRNHAAQKEGKITPMSTKLVEHGCYTFLRHPQYFGYMIFAVGFLALYNSYLLATISALIIISLYVGIIGEEKLLIEQFDNQYKEYMQRTPRINVFIGLWRYFFAK